jgi:hypothetical protein
MRRRSHPLALAFVFISVGTSAFAQATDVTPCELAKNPSKYDHKLVRVSSKISLAFEDFSLTADCDRAPGVWLIFGGDVSTPTSSTFNDVSRTPGTTLHIEKIPIPLRKDANFQLFYDRLTARRERNGDGTWCYDCYFYSVSATLTGIFFAGDAKSEMPGYGHIGCCRLLAIEKIERVSSERTKLEPPGDFLCSEKNWKWKVDRKAAFSLQAFVDEGHQPWRLDDIRTIVGQSIDERRRTWADASFGKLLEPDEPTKLDREWIVDGYWVSYDGLTSYAATLKKPAWLMTKAKKLDWEVWLPYSVYRWQCLPVEVEKHSAPLQNSPSSNR